MFFFREPFSMLLHRYVCIVALDLRTILLSRDTSSLAVFFWKYHSIVVFLKVTLAHKLQKVDFALKLSLSIKGESNLKFLIILTRISIRMFKNYISEVLNALKKKLLLNCVWFDAIRMNRKGMTIWTFQKEWNSFKHWMLESIE